VRHKRFAARCLSLMLTCAATPLLADEPPSIEHQPIPCTIPAVPFMVCAAVSDDEAVSKVRVYFRAEREKYYTMAEMAFGGLNYCSTLPAPRPGKVRVIEYYIQAVDSGLNFERTPTYQMSVKGESECAFPPVDKDAASAAIVVYATSKKQGKKLHKAFERAGVTFIPSKAQ
jgi:hypothetical protein